MIQDIPETAGAQEDQPRCPAATTTGQAHATGNATGNAMGRRAWKKTSVGTQALEEHQGPGKVDLSWVQI
jgi:hypothetical protein